MADHIRAARSSRPAQPGVPTSMVIDTHVGGKRYASPLLWLPCELLVHMASYLSTDDLCSLRLTCRRVERFLFDGFAEEFFSDRRFMVIGSSLECLVNIAKHAELSKRLSKLTIGLDRLYSADAAEGARGRNYAVYNGPGAKGIDPHKLEELFSEQNWLLASGDFQLLLGEALENLPNVVDISIRDANVVRSTCRPESNQHLVSYGVTEICRQTGVDLLSDESHLMLQDQFADIVFTATLFAAARTGKRLNAITTDIQKRGMGLSSLAFVIPESLSDPLRLTLENLQSLDLSVSFTYAPLGSFSHGSLGFLRWQSHYLFKLLEYATNIVRLRVKSQGQSMVKDGVIGWLAKLVDLLKGEEVEPSHLYGTLHASIDNLALAQRFQTLQHLELENMIAPAKSLCKVMMQLTGSLRKLNLCMVGVSILPADDELDNNPCSPNAWRLIFREMTKSDSLEELHVDSLGHHTQNCSRVDNRHQVVFLPSEIGVQSGPRNGLLLNTWSHAGSNAVMKNFLLELVGKTFVICDNCKQRNAGYRTIEDILEAEMG
ncbi:hypothetical protein M426DRAFT_321197 [Hypoxylon sp. CI-4A]|nr:hypothetical protein M426DRAFT_321197 [Hypoxylon sp. CI-4A]